MGAPESHHATLFQHHVGTSGRISSSPLFFLFHAKFAEPANQDIFIFPQSVFDLLQQDFNQLSGSIFRKSEFIVNSIYNLCFCQCHRSVAPVLRKPLISLFPPSYYNGIAAKVCKPDDCVNSSVLHLGMHVLCRATKLNVYAYTAVCNFIYCP